MRKHQEKNSWGFSQQKQNVPRPSITYITKLNILAVITLATTTYCARANFRRFNPRIKASAGFLIATWSRAQVFGRWEAVKVLPVCIKPLWEILAVVLDTLAKHGKAENNPRGGESISREENMVLSTYSMQVYANLPYLTNLMELERMILGRGTEQIFPPLNL